MKVTFIWISHLLLITSHALFLIISPCKEEWYWRAVPPFVIMGIAYCLLYVCIWPSIPLSVRPEMIGYAYGASISIHNVGVAVGPLISSVIIDSQESSEKYEALNIFLLWISCAGLVSTYGLWRSDRVKYKGILQRPWLKVIKTPLRGNKIIKANSDFN